MENKLSTVGKAIQILKILRQHEDPLGVTDLAKMLSVDKAGAHRILNTLKDELFVVQDMSSKKYSLGPGLLWLAGGMIKNDLVAELTKNLMTIRDFTGETVSITRPMGSVRVTIAGIESNRSIRRALPVGTIIPIHKGTSGKVMLANLPSAEQAKTLLELKETGMIDQAELSSLQKIIRLILNDGYYYASGDREPNVAAISFPLHGKKALFGVLTISGPSYRLTFEAIEPHIGRIKEELEKMLELIHMRE